MNLYNIKDNVRRNEMNQNQNNDPKNDGPKNKQSLLVLLICIMACLVCVNLLSRMTRNMTSEIPYSQFIEMLENGEVESVVLRSDTLTITPKTQQSMVGTTEIYTTLMEDESELTQRLEEAGVENYYKEPPDMTSSIIYSLLSIVLPVVIMVGLFSFLFRRMNKGGGMMGGVGKSRAKAYVQKETGVTFKDVAGEDEAKESLQEVVDFLHNPGKYAAIGAKLPKGALLVGPPGTGKTLLAKAVAGEAHVPFFSLSGSDFVEMFVGVGASRVRDLFEEAKKNAPCIIFIDEVDAIGKTRDSRYGGNDEREQTLNQLLAEMDGFDTSKGLLILAATNRPDVLDPALLRPGRFDRQVVVELPDVQERLDVLRIHTRKVHLEPSVSLDRIARATPGTSGADLANLVNEAALFAARDNRMTVSMEDFEKARDKIILGVARESRFMTEEEKRATAYHEAGHTLMHYYLPTADPLHKVTIIPHGRALGITMSLPEKDIYSRNQTMLEELIMMIMGGYAAEKIVYGVTTTGTSNDNQKSTEIARKMVTEWGMSDLGFINLSSNGDEPIFLGREIAQHKDYSEETARRIDEEVQKILKRCMDFTMKTLTEHRDQLDRLTEELVRKETLDDAEIREMFGFPPVKHITELK